MFWAHLLITLDVTEVDCRGECSRTSDSAADLLWTVLGDVRK